MDIHPSPSTLFLMEEHIGHNFFTPQHFHKVFEIYYLEAGKVEYFIKDRVYSIEAGDILIIPPQTLHKTISPQNHNRKRILVYLDLEYLKDFDARDFLFLNTVSVFRPQNHDRIRTVFSDLWKEYQGEKNASLVKALLCEFLILLKRRKEESPKANEQNAASRQVRDIITYINMSYNTDITLTKTANHFFLQSTYLSRLFKENTGLSFSDYLRKYRVKKAIECMADSQKNITEIAFSVGFNSTNHFCKTFKAIMGVSPLQYKKQHCKKD